ncbi:F-box domain protein [Aspergillus mulundensis]|uniref:Uncharacterized protein n=1 Tax=Aspergillus mulundensis TaxID=1810919 RepID=A0A3D8QZ69_9EURO|nr:hypothetical protein DSM5745_08962 [Aspergillus mulundensis]RDW67096.1 hypothetical protein DSM5745_08962 [Aspergillus mulundensis]
MPSSRTPGPPLDTSSLSTRSLFLLLKARASKQLYGSQFDASCTTFRFGDRVPNIKASSLAVDADETLIITPYSQDVVQILQVRNGQIAPLRQARLPWYESGSIEILKTAYGDDRLYVLYRFTPFMEGDDHPFVRQAREYGRNGFIYLACHPLELSSNPVRMTMFPGYEDFNPSALAVATDGAFAIVWCHRMSLSHAVVHYTAIDKSEYDIAPNLVGFSYSSRQLRRFTGGPMIRDLAFNDRSSQLLYYYQGRSLYAGYQNIASSTMYENSTSVQFTHGLSLLYSIEVPFFGTHESDGFACRWMYLSLGIATHRKENWTVACLLRSEAICRAGNCGHAMNLERGRRLTQWDVVARLYGFRNATSSLGCKVAASPKGTRIAIANWNVLYIWALEPEALIEMDPRNYYQSSWRSSSTGQIELQPIVLRLDAVCFQLRFTKEEDELVVITDQGIMVWDLTSPSGNRTCQNWQSILTAN